MPAYLRGFVQNYEWGVKGDVGFVANLSLSGEHISEVAADKPYAELWLGNHPNGPCFVKEGDNIVKPINAWLGENKCRELPFLLKVLSVGKALSIQSHPNEKLAQQLHSSRPEVYKDPFAKPELAVALTDMRLLCGFRPTEEIKKFFHQSVPLRELIGSALSSEILDGKDSPDLLKRLYSAVMLASPSSVAKAVKSIIAQTSILDACHPIEVMRELLKDFPTDDAGVLAPFFMNVLSLSPGEALFIPPDTPHAYLSGELVECMAGSDNVIRGGLTPKFKDIPVLLDSISYYHLRNVGVMNGVLSQDIGFNSISWNPVPQFKVSHVRVTESINWRAKSVTILLVLRGEGSVGSLPVSSGSAILLDKDEIAIIKNDRFGSAVEIFIAENGA